MGPYRSRICAHSRTFTIHRQWHTGTTHRSHDRRCHHGSVPICAHAHTHARHTGRTHTTAAPTHHATEKGKLHTKPIQKCSGSASGGSASCARQPTCRPATPKPRNSDTNSELECVSVRNCCDMLLKAFGVALSNAVTAPPMITIQYRSSGPMLRRALSTQIGFAVPPDGTLRRAVAQASLPPKA